MSLTPKRLLKTEIFQKMQSFLQRNYLTIFSPIIEYSKPQGTILRVRKYPGKYCGSIKIKYLGSNRLLKT